MFIKRTLRWVEQAGMVGLGVCLLWGAQSHAAMQLSRTRLVLVQDVPKASIEARNQDRVPLLLQAWISTTEEDGAEAPQPQNLPLIVDPPIARLEPGQARALQVLLTQIPAEFATDREAVFWLNVLEVPGIEEIEQARSTHAANASDSARLYLAVQSRLKVFYRPQAIAAVSPVALDADARLRFTAVRDAAQQLWLEIHNPAPIHQTLDRVTLSPATEGASALELADLPMLAPFATTRLALPTVFDPQSAGWHVVFSILDDDGNPLEHTQALARAPARTGTTP